MGTGSESRLLRVWLLLVGITVMTWFLGVEEGALGTGGTFPVIYAALAIVAVKVRIIVVEYMEARRFSKKVQTIMDTWLLLLVAGLMAIYAFHWNMPAV